VAWLGADRSCTSPEEIIDINGTTPVATRAEHDALGTVAVPLDRMWGAQTERSRHHFAIGDPLAWRWPRSVIRALGLVKGAAAEANFRLGGLNAEVAAVIAQAAAEVIGGQWDAEFPLGVFQTGSGTHTNMNANEVIANRANQLAGGALGAYTPVHPNDHVNLSQSSNDVFPAVMHLATLDALQVLEGPVHALSSALARHSARWQGLPMLGRTHLQDATPIMLGDVVGSWAAQLDQAWARVEQSRVGLYALPLGATAVGTGLNAHPDFGANAVAVLAANTGYPLHLESNLPAALAAHDAMAAVSAALRGLAGVLFKVANDVRLYASGPRGGLGELRLPANEPGSSIMPGKVNPSQCEALTMVAVHVFGCDATVAWANAQGPLQLNVYKPVILHNVLEPARLLADACRAFTTFCIDGLEADPVRIETHLQASLMLVTALVPHIGHERAAAIALTADRDGLSLRDAAVASGIVSGEDFDRWVDPAEMARPAR
jgi:fumarate hydratase class II